MVRIDFNRFGRSLLNKTVFQSYTDAFVSSFKFPPARTAGRYDLNVTFEVNATIGMASSAFRHLHRTSQMDGNNVSSHRWNIKFAGKKAMVRKMKIVPTF